ncbi:MAG: hypothetical protein LRS47_01295 [Desulfurococcales archaeon]|nr:hypothetical protein [Desulfurococcales archaeon]
MSIEGFKLEEIAERLRKLASLAVDIVDNLPAEYRKDAFVETYRYLLTLYSGRSVHDASVHAAEGVQASSPTVVPASSQAAEDIGADEEESSLAEFVNRLSIKPKTNAEWITVFAYYMKYHENKKMFSVKEVKDYFKAIGLKVPGNLFRDINNAVKKGYIARDIGSKRESKIYYITRKGEELVRGMLRGKE